MIERVREGGGVGVERQERVEEGKEGLRVVCVVFGAVLRGNGGGGVEGEVQRAFHSACILKNDILRRVEDTRKVEVP